jgi:hypothetical protein
MMATHYYFRPICKQEVTGSIPVGSTDERPATAGRPQATQGLTGPAQGHPDESRVARTVSTPQKLRLSKSFQKIWTWLVVPSQLGTFSVRVPPPPRDFSW